VCGVVPFGGNLVETLLAHQTSERPAARDLSPMLPAALDELINRLISHDPADRPQSVADLATALTAIRTNTRPATVIPASSPALTILGRQRTRRVLVWTALLAIAIGVAVGALIVARRASFGARAVSPTAEDHNGPASLRDPSGSWWSRGGSPP